ncbi:uncharacterized protein LOC112208650 isoform X1 [Pan troglodytes]|uniref:uncharacterized protein LOC112208650 isoform X1 n=1 Tax=Pan troglodytes TaxID=9598 RepID=UPI0023F0D373|nr:uncharacterized protein LOC112208650 isoform X1 [Pan troglodytes]
MPRSLLFHLTRNTHRCGGATHPFIWCPTWRLFSRVKVRSSMVIEDKSTRDPEYVYSQPYVCRCTQQLRRDSDHRERAMMTMAVLSRRKGGNVGKSKRDQIVTVSV